MSHNECYNLCLNWNANPPANLGRLPCVGFETTSNPSGTGGGDGRGNGICGLIRTSSVECPGYDYRRHPDRDSANEAFSASDICKINPMSNINEDLMSCYRIFPGNSNDCPNVAMCSLTAG